ncbi:MAG: glycosyltransferase [Deltaproteobacteria bacterium]|nr:glycosyltransferase [Deltaproteobacteria bacterium]
MKTIGIVIPWFGRGLKGGAEQLAWQVASRLAERGHQIEALTTCCREFSADWAKNHYRPGNYEEGNIIVRRFPVDGRDHGRFSRINAHMLGLSTAQLKPGVNPVADEDAALFVNHSINSEALLAYLKEHRERYHAVIFIPYLYGLILQGVPLVADRAYLQPCLHDEVYAYLPQVARTFYLCRGVLYNSEGEMILGSHLYGPAITAKSFFVGSGTECLSDCDLNLSSVRGFDLPQTRYILCLGRKDPTKNTHLIINAFARFKERHPASDLRLVFAGPGQLPVGRVPNDVLDLGLVTEPEKEALLANCLALFQPSCHESYSRVIMEAWMHKRPVAAHQECLATSEVVGRADGGWVADTEADWAELFSKVDLMDGDELTARGGRGHAYAQENADWSKIIDRYEKILRVSDDGPVVTRPRPTRLEEIHQLLPDIAVGDVITNQAVVIRNHLRDLGYRSKIFVLRQPSDQIAHEASVLNKTDLSNKAGVIYHHSPGSDLTPVVVAHPGPKALIYHDIYPAEFSRPYHPELAKVLEDGRRDLPLLARHFSLSIGGSQSSAAELEACGFHHPYVLNLTICPDKWAGPPDPTWMARLQDGRVNLLFVGRIAPNKGQDHLLESFHHYLALDPYARLVIVGSFIDHDPFYRHLIQIINKLSLQRHVMMTGQVSDSQLQACYQTADLFWSMSEHEGYCGPLVEAMWFDVPVLAYNAAAVPETMGRAGILFNRKDNLAEVAALAKIIVTTDSLRDTVLKYQRQRRQDFRPETIWPVLDEIVSRFEANQA